MRKLKRGDMRNKCPNIRVLQRPIYKRARMRVYAGLVNCVVYASAKCVLQENGCSYMIAINMAVEVKYLVSVYLLFSVCYCSSPVTEVLETVMRLVNGCSSFSSSH